MSGFAVPATKKAKLLWTNPSPNLAFNAQTISIDLSDYQCLEYIVKSRGQASGVNPMAIFKAPKGATAFVLPTQETTAVVTRVVTVADNFSVTFGNGNFYNFTDGYSEAGGNYAVPIEIYGIK